jgi:glucan 1,3-beta-glucosidase
MENAPDNAFFSSYYEAYMMIRGITGLGNGNGPFVSIHDAFAESDWAGFMAGADRLALDFHPYAIFSGGPSTAPPASFSELACNGWGNFINKTSSNFGMRRLFPIEDSY